MAWLSLPPAGLVLPLGALLACVLRKAAWVLLAKKVSFYFNDGKIKRHMKSFVDSKYKISLIYLGRCHGVAEIVAQEIDR